MSAMSRRSFLKLGGSMMGAAALGSVMAGCGNTSRGAASTAATGASGSTASQSSNHVILGYWGGTCEMPIYVGYEKGFFRDAGLDAEIVKITEDVAPLMATGELDCFELTPDKFKPMEQGLECVIIDSLHYGCQQGVSSAASGIKSPLDLEGKNVAASIGSIAQIALAASMVDGGLDPSKVNWLTYKNAQMDQALASGEIDCFAAYDPWPDISLSKDSSRVRFWSWTYDEGIRDILCCFVGLSTKRLKAAPEVGPMLCQGFKQSADWIRSNPEDACDLAINAGYVPVGTDAGFTREMMIQEVQDYRFISGNKDEIDKSFAYIWDMIAKAGAMEDAPSDPAELDKYINETLYNRMVDYQGE
ncbi:MAG: ABC transporter substrate-binding protein [Coriobacteriales bacterium]|nr:ABC transporter substrate-binding protein [Coriobacteriales bacterium]